MLEYDFGTGPLSYGHTTVKAPHPIRTAKLSTVGPDQYFGRGLQGNLGCCMSFLFFLQNMSRSNNACPVRHGFPPETAGCRFSSTQGSVQIELIFRLLLKITVDWPSNAIIQCL